jgi:hypothetical protein
MHPLIQCALDSTARGSSHSVVRKRREARIKQGLIKKVLERYLECKDGKEELSVVGPKVRK